MEHYKDNREEYWFKRSIYGWGFVPAKWQGWLAFSIYFGLILTLVFTREEYVPGVPDSGSNLLVFALPVIVLTTIFITLCYKKGEKSQ